MATRHRLTAKATANLSGAAEFVFRGATSSFDYVGNVSVPGAPSAATFTVIIGDLTELTFYGTNPAGPFLLHPNDVMKVEATGLTNGVEYQMVWPVTEYPAGSVAVTPTAVGGLTNAVVSGSVTANQGAPGTIPNSWFFEITNGINVIGVPGAPLRVDFAGNVPVGGTVVANQGTPNSLANGWPVEITDGTNVLGTGAHPVVITGLVGSQVAGPSTGQQTWSAGGPVQLHAGSVPVVRNIILKPLHANTQPVYVGVAGVSTSTGFELAPTDPPIYVSCSDLNLLYVLGTHAGDGVCWNVQ